MKIALIIPLSGGNDGNRRDGSRAGLAVGLDGGRLVDVTAAAELARTLGGAPSRLPTVRTVKDFLSAGEDERRTVSDLADWVQHLPEPQARAADALRDEADVRFLPPVRDPNQFLCVGKNYAAHLDELKRTELIREIPDEPTGFVKLNSVIAAHEDEIPRPSHVTEFDYEPELAFVIGQPAYKVPRERAMEFVYGITLFNDLTDREAQRREVRSGTRFWTAKNLPRCGPIGPYVVSLEEVGDVDHLTIECHVNGERRMRYSTSGQINKIPDIVEHFSKTIPLEPGDLFATGSAAGVAVGQPNAAELFLKPGDVVDVVLEGGMTLRNTIVDDD